MCSNYPGIKLEPALGTLEDKIEHLSSYAHVVHTTEKQVISRRRKNENVYKMSKNEKCTSSCLLKLPIKLRGRCLVSILQMAEANTIL